MIMDPRFSDYSDSFNGFKETIFTSSDDYFDLENDFKFKDESIDLSFMDTHRRSDDVVSAPPFASFSPQGEESSSSDSSDLSDPVFKYISQMLMDEDMDEKPSMLHESLALHATEKSLYEALGGAHPLSPDQPPLSLDSPPNNLSSGCSDDYSSGSSTVTRSTSVETKPQSLFTASKNYNGNGGFNEIKPVTSLPLSDFFSNSESILQFNKGVEEASKFLPKASNLIVDLDNYAFTADRKEVVANNNVVVKVEDEEKELSPNWPKGRKRGDMDLKEERVNKQSAIYVDEEELSEMFDRVLLSCKVKPEPEPYDGIPIPDDDLKNVQTQVSSNGKGRGKKQENQREVVDLRTLLILCAQAVSADDRRTANDLLKQIRQHSSPLGDGTQRLAHCFANGLEARLSGTGTQIYTALASKRTSAADILKAYQLYIQACPFKKISMGFANLMIIKAADEAKTLHIIDFGILYGFQWPILIHHLSIRDGGPPKLRVTGIELPQSGFRPAERVEETGRRLAKYCERFNVPFEYNAIAQKWDSIQVKDLKIDANNEVVVVNCLYRFRNLLDETVIANNSPRNAVLNLIRKIKPNVFVHSIVNGSYNAPFFVTRFREALFQYSALFDMCDTIVPRDNPERLMYEREFCGREVMNVVACEGSERVERPETYKQWHVRNTRAGFRQLPLDKEIMSLLKDKCNDWYHKDFVVDQDGGWVLIGWKGRILYASSCWYPA